MKQYLKTQLLRFFPLIAFAVVVIAALTQIKFGTMGDKGWLLHAAGEMASGKKLYTDIFEVNPPLILWLYSIPVWLARNCYFLQDYAALGLTGLCVITLSIRLSCAAIARHPAFEGSAYRQTLFGLMLATSYIYLTSPIYFFDREHIMLVMAMPYILRFSPSLTLAEFPRRLRITIALCAAVGFFIKPHALVVFAGLQLYYFLRDRSPKVLLSLENRTIYLMGVIYVAVILCTVPEYFTTVLPMALATYSHFNVRGSIHSYLPLATSSLVIPLLDFRTRFVTPYRPEVYYFLWVIVLYGLYALLNNGWGYTYHPLFSMMFVLTCWLYLEYKWLKTEHEKQELPTRPFEFGMRAASFCLGINWLYGLLSLQVMVLSYNCGGYTGCEDNALFVEYIADHHVKSYGLMSAEFTRWPQISRQSGAKWDTRFNHLWMFPAMQNDGKGPTPEQGWIVSYVGNAYASDLSKHKPDVVFVDNSDEFFTSRYHIDILAVLNKTPAFTEAWSHYHFAQAINRCASNKDDKDKTFHAIEGCRYDIYAREEAVKP